MSEASRDLGKGLERALARIGVTAEVVDLERLSGGANMESWAFSCGSGKFVLRRAPSAEMMTGRRLDHAGEAAVIRAARAAGVPSPEVMVELEPDDGSGSGFVMRRIAGSASPASLLDAGGALLLADLAAALAAIHRVDPAKVAHLPTLDAGEGVAGLAVQFASYGGDRPIIALGLAWLRANLPAPVASCLIHGDFRVGNLMAEDGRLTGVLDWELAHLGDFHEDLAFGCMAVWRFGRLDKPGFGLGSLEELFGAYRVAGGGSVDLARVRFWLVYRTVWWALGCLAMGATWRSGADRSVERVVVARRAAEQELDLLLLLEGEAPAAERERALPLAAPQSPPALGEPDSGELLTAVAEWLGTIKERLSGRERFDLAVARNALGIAARELALRPQAHNKGLSGSLLTGEFSLAEPGLLARLRRIAMDKLAADQPKYPSLAVARALWKDS